MSRNRIIYQSEALFIGPSPATGYHFSSGNSGANLVKQIHRTQNVDHQFSISRQDVNQLGQLAAIDRVILESPSVSLNFEFLLSDAENFKRLGLRVDGASSAISGLLNKTEDEKNYYIKIVDEGKDAVGAGLVGGVFGIGNGFLSSFSTTAQVGGFPSASLSVEALNVEYNLTSTGISSPAVNPTDGLPIDYSIVTVPNAVSGVAGQISVLRPGDISFSLGGAGLGFDINDAKIQSYNLSFDLSREPLNKLGSRFAFSKEIQFPVTVQLSIEALVGDLTSGNLSDILCDDRSYNLGIILKEPNCTGGFSDTALRFDLKGAKFDSQSWGGMSVGGDAASVSLQFSAQLAGPEDLGKGLFISGKTFS